jgi:hypothetical protein
MKMSRLDQLEFEKDIFIFMSGKKRLPEVDGKKMGFIVKK